MSAAEGGRLPSSRTRANKTAAVIELSNPRQKKKPNPHPHPPTSLPDGRTFCLSSRTFRIASPLVTRGGKGKRERRLRACLMADARVLPGIFWSITTMYPVCIGHAKPPAPADVPVLPLQRLSLTRARGLDACPAHWL